MEINGYGDTILPAVAAETLYEGRMARLCTHSTDYDFGSLLDLPGAELPDNAAEALTARYVIAWAEDNRSLPIYTPQSHYGWALREGWDQIANVPFDATVWLDHPANMYTPPSIASGTGVRLLGEGIYTIPSGVYMYNVLMETPGTQLTVASTDVNGAGNAGKLKYLDGTTGIVAEVYKYNSTNGDLTFKILH